MNQNQQTKRTTIKQVNTTHFLFPALCSLPPTVSKKLLKTYSQVHSILLYRGTAENVTWTNTNELELLLLSSFSIVPTSYTLQPLYTHHLFLQ